MNAVKAHTVAVEEPVDLLAFAGDDGLLFERDGVGVAGRGEAFRVTGTVDELPARVTEALADIEGDNDDVVAMGALPFDRGAVGSLVVPATTLRRRADGTTWMTTIGAPADEARPTATPRPPDGFVLESVLSHDEWSAVVRQAVEAVRAGRMRKVVLAREVRVEANRPIVPVDVLRRLRALYPSCHLFSADGFIGASPELLVSRTGRSVASHPLAGTIPRSGDPVVDARLADALLSSEKDRLEHRLVVDEVAAVLRRFCDVVDVPEAPSIVPLRNVSHLGTLLHGEGDVPSALALAAALHPTPAVGGTPTDEALRYIADVERLDRGRYAGPVGWVDARGDGEWAVGIRCAELDGNRARLFAGVGVVSDSDPEAELVETQLKLQALLAALVRP